MKTNSYLTIPCHWDLEVLKEILKQKEDQGIILKDMYGTLPQAPIGHGRNPSVLKSLGKKDICSFRNILKKNHIDFAYILNSPISKKELEKNSKEIEEYLKWILKDIKPDSLVISSLDFMKLVRKVSNIPITISTISRVKTVKDIKKYLEINPFKIVVQHDVNRNFNELKKIVKFADKNNILIEVMLTESCRRRCPLMIKHYETVGLGKSDKSFHRKCNVKKIQSPEELLLANFIRPEDMTIYEKIGIKNFKITGRSKNPSWLPEVVNAYRKRKFNGNLIRLLGIDPCLDAEKWIYISNPSLDGFLKDFPQKGKVKTEKEYCKKWIKKLYYNGNFWINNFEYKDVKETLVPKGDVENINQINKIYFKSQNEN